MVAFNRLWGHLDRYLYISQQKFKFYSNFCQKFSLLIPIRVCFLAPQKFKISKKSFLTHVT